MADLTLVVGSRNLSSWSLRPWLVLRRCGRPFAEVEIALDRPETQNRIREHSAAARVPVLHHGDLTVWDSLAIVEYLAEILPAGAVWPEALDLRARARSVCAEMHAGFATLRQEMPMAFKETRPAPTPRASLEGDIDRIRSLWRTLRERHRGDGDFLFGTFSAADAFYAPVVSRFRTYGVTLDGPAADWAAMMWELPEMREWLAGC